MRCVRVVKGPYCFDRLKLNFEKYLLLHRRFEIKSHLKSLSQDDLYSVEGGHVILSEFKGFIQYFRDVYPSLPVHITDLENVSRNYWRNSLNIKFFLQYISQKIPFRITQHHHWRDLDSTILRKYNGETLYQYHPSVLQILETSFPEFSWSKIWRFPSDSRPEIQRRFVDGLLGAHLGVGHQEDFTHIAVEDLARCPGGHNMLLLYGYSLRGLFSHLYPELAPSYDTVQHGYWKRLEGNPFLQRVMRTWDVRNKEEWYRLSSHQLECVYNRSISKKNMIPLLEFWTPEEEWDYSRFADKNKKSRQKLLGKLLREVIFPKEVIFEEYQFKTSERWFVFDFYLPGQNMVVEYQGEQHYFNVSQVRCGIELQMVKDQEKADVCIANGFKLVIVPYWWYSSVKS
eukprot:TRINITY_DN22136_c0_g1_i1.p1 TRINITY_DN22136_c0_g1~~TRINITY_DN22136_c0_g1_i1.p1  ORF type:complete len:400 (-),score=46.11 TRINITY_DN22136_c0_g1_i1:39-1238(-)